MKFCLPDRLPLRRWRAALLCGVVFIAACAGRPSPTLLSLPLVAAPSVTAPMPPTSTSLTQPPPSEPAVLVVRRVALPEYLLSRRVRYRADASLLGEWPDTVWAERIEVAASRELLAGLRRALPGWTVCEPGCTGAPQAARVVSLRIELAAMDFLRSNGRLQSSALVTLESVGQPPRQFTLQRDVVAGGDTPQAHAQAIAELLQGLALTVAEAVRSRAPG
jgi:uncharacterized lipoprotein YmbA